MFGILKTSVQEIVYCRILFSSKILAFVGFNLLIFTSATASQPPGVRDVGPPSSKSKERDARPSRLATKAGTFNRVFTRGSEKSGNLRADRLIHEGIKKLDVGLYDEAIALFSLAIKIVPNHDTAFYNRAYAYSW